MDMKETIRSVIEDYFTITGRPIATLTVNEYSKFIDIAKSMTGAGSGTENNMHTFQNAPADIDHQSLQKIENETRENEYEIHEGKALPEFISIKSADSRASVPAEKKKPSKEEMLKILRSVNS